MDQISNNSSSSNNSTSCSRNSCKAPQQQTIQSRADNNVDGSSSQPNVSTSMHSNSTTTAATAAATTTKPTMMKIGSIIYNSDEYYFPPPAPSPPSKPPSSEGGSSSNPANKRATTTTTQTRRGSFRSSLSRNKRRMSFPSQRSETSLASSDWSESNHTTEFKDEGSITFHVSGAGSAAGSKQQQHPKSESSYDHEQHKLQTRSSSSVPSGAIVVEGRDGRNTHNNNTISDGDVHSYESSDDDMSFELLKDHSANRSEMDSSYRRNAYRRNAGLRRSISKRASSILVNDAQTPSTDSMEQPQLRAYSVLSRETIFSMKDSMVGSSRVGSSFFLTTPKSHTNLFDSNLGCIERIRLFCGMIVKSSSFQVSIVVLIILNALAMGLATFDFVEDNPNIARAFEICDYVFLVIFTIELVLQITYNGIIQFFCDGWLVFDFIVVVASWGLESFQVVRSFRIFRAFRLIARLELLRNLVQAIIQVMPRMYAISALLFLVSYIYGVMCTELFSDLYSEGATDEDYFGRLDLSLFTLFQMITLDWSLISRQVQEVFQPAWAIFSSFVFLTGFIVYNLIVAVVCEAVKEIEAFSKKQKKKEDAERRGTIYFDENEFQKEQLVRIKLMRSRLSHLIKSQNDILLAARSSLEGMEGIRPEVAKSILYSPEGIEPSSGGGGGSFRRAAAFQENKNVPSFFGSMDDRTDEFSISSSELQ